MRASPPPELPLSFLRRARPSAGPPAATGWSARAPGALLRTIATATLVVIGVPLGGCAAGTRAPTSPAEPEPLPRAPAPVSASATRATEATSPAPPADAPAGPDVEPVPAAAARPSALLQRPIPAMARGGPALAVTARVRTGSLPKSVETSPDGRFVVVCNFGRLDEDNLWVYDAATLDVVARVSVRGNPVETLFTADASTLYVSSFKTHEVHELDVATWTVRRSIPVGKNPKVMALSRDEQRLFVANWTTNTISVIDRASGQTLHELPTLEHPRGLAIRSDGVVITAAMYDHTVHVFAPEGDGYRERARFTACQYPRHFALVPDESLLVMSCSGTDSVQWWDVDAGKRRGYARAGDNPRSMAMDRSGRWVVVANFRSSDVTLIDLHAGTWANHAAPETDRIVGIALQPPAPGEPPGVPASPPRVYATSWGNNQLLALEPR